MLDSDTKKRIDDLRGVLVGKIPSPESQVEQITTGLIYKFMNDMDSEAVELGGIPSFFVGDFEKYSWKNLFDPKLGGADKVVLYSNAIEAMYTNPNAPILFREIFKNSFLPFKDPSTLNMFLKGINEFHYSHSEKLGDAFEYLLSFMGSQGDAGQFRTPRHIIDFIVDIVNPQKNEIILDPACGTAGFLISSYKHILSQNTDKKFGDKLNASDRKQVGDNLVGYDISPDMTRISLVNMYLHQFASPQIHEYDTLSSEDRWNEYYDVILANPPFFSPTGGIQPHSRFGVQSTRAEVLFVDYIMEHLKPTGRAGIVVPEGIIFQTGNAYKILRKKLVEDCLVGVISLPAGVFQPYSGVKTSILILDKELNQKSDCIFFAKVENDGFSLGAQRTAIKKNDLPRIKDDINKFLRGIETDIQTVSKETLVNHKEVSFSSSLYLEQMQSKSNFETVKLSSVSEFVRGVTFSKRDQLQEQTNTSCKVVTTKAAQSNGIVAKHCYFIEKNLVKNSDKFLIDNDILISLANSLSLVGRTTFVDSAPSETCFGAFMGVIRAKQDLAHPKYLNAVLNSEAAKQFFINNSKTTTNISNLSFSTLSDFSFPLPPIDIQQQIVDELDGYQKIIDGCRQVVENYKPTIDIDPSWEMVELASALSNISNGSNYSSDQVGKGTKVLSVKDFDETSIFISTSNCQRVELTSAELERKAVLENDILVVRSSGSDKKVGMSVLVPKLSEKVGFNGFLIKLTANSEKLNPYFLCSLLRTDQYRKLISGGANKANINNVSQDTLKSLLVPLPSLSNQNKIVTSIKQEAALVDGSQKLIDIYTKKIQDTISKLWGS